MRKMISINENWAFFKGETFLPASVPADWETVTLPHTWNAFDGQDGGNDYFRGDGWYVKELHKADLPESDCCILSFNGAFSSADMYVNGRKKMHHDGGFSTWRCDITEELQKTGTALIAVCVNNAPNDHVYPQMADFTFYGGLYRDAQIFCVSHSHFDLETLGTPGIHVTPIVNGKNADVEVKWSVTNGKVGQSVRVRLMDRDGNVVAETQTQDDQVVLQIADAHLWNGRKDPYLYTCTAQLMEGEAVLDEVSARFGCRSFRVDPENGFILNGQEYPLRGVARHQDRWQMGNALRKEQHEEDIELICEVGATTIRLAHYQHDQYFYDLCDEKGLVIWAEIPYISQHMPEGRDNTVSQMKELITQSYNHPSICFWGLSNEITMRGADDPDMIENHRILNDLVHSMDKTRLTTLAALSACPMDAEYLQIPDVVSYNHYFGWYGGTTDMNGPWLDKFHKKYPNRAIGVSEYGAEGLNWHSSTPEQGDYTEEYQAKYHEDLIRQLFTRKYIWATHCWNMFDFGADARSEGGENGQNHKGLVTIDRKYKKDAFYAYKAWLSDEPFVHICGKRYVDRVEDVTRVTVYSNQPKVELFANGESLGVKEAEDHFFYFNVPNIGETELKAIAGNCTDESVIRKVDSVNEAYILQEKNAILNWFDIEKPEGYLNITDKISDIMGTLRGKLLLAQIGLVLAKRMKQAEGPKKASKEKKKKKSGGNPLRGVDFSGMLSMLGGFTILRLSGMMSMANLTITKEDLLAVNRKLNKIKRKH